MSLILQQKQAKEQKSQLIIKQNNQIQFSGFKHITQSTSKQVDTPKLTSQEEEDTDQKTEVDTENNKKDVLVSLNIITSKVELNDDKFNNSVDTESREQKTMQDKVFNNFYDSKANSKTHYNQSRTLNLAIHNLKFTNRKKGTRNNREATFGTAGTNRNKSPRYESSKISPKTLAA